MELGSRVLNGVGQPLLEPQAGVEVLSKEKVQQMGPGGDVARFRLGTPSQARC